MTNSEFVDDKKIKDILTYIRSLKHAEQEIELMNIEIDQLKDKIEASK